MNEILAKSQEIIDKAILDFKPQHIFMMFSGGDDSLTAWQVARALNVPVTHFVHGNTRVGIKETTLYCREIGQSSGIPYLEADAGTSYDDYVLRKGFFGRGNKAHSFAYHVLKAKHFRRVAASFRQRRHNYNILFVNGARESESDNRAENLPDVYNIDPSVKSNIWVNIIHHWSSQDCSDFLLECHARRNPVTKILCRSGECMCGTMQSKEELAEAVYWYPKFGQRIDGIRARVLEKFTWDWGEHISDYAKARMAGQMEFEDFTPEFQPACTSCRARYQETA